MAERYARGGGKARNRHRRVSSLPASPFAGSPHHGASKDGQWGGWIWSLNSKATAVMIS